MKRPATQKFFAGVSSTDITPTPKESDAYSAGPPKFERRFPGGVAAPLLAKALATRAGDKTILLISGDLHSTPAWLSNAVRDALSERCGLPREAIAICTSQTHSAPPLAAEDPGDDPAQPWNRRLVTAMIDLGAKAIADLQPARIGVTKGYNHSVPYNTRLPITDDLPPGVCPDLERHRGGCMLAREHPLGRTGGTPLDPELGVIRVDRANGDPLAVLFHFSCHPATVIEGPTMHGDYTGFAAAEIEKKCPGITALYLQGSLANVHSRGMFRDAEYARQSGLEIAAEVLRVLPEAATADRVEMDHSSEPFAVTFIPFPAERLRRLIGYYREFLAASERDPQASWVGAGPDTLNLPPRFPAAARRNMITRPLAYCEAKLAKAERGEAEPMTPKASELQLFTWNDIALCLHNWEMYVQTGMEIKRRSPSRYTFPVGNANTLIGYVAPPEEFALGGYEVVTSPMYNNFPGPYDPDNPRRIAEAFLARLNARYRAG